MTLVVSEASSHGIVMVGDSAVTVKQLGMGDAVNPGAVKVQYSCKANVGFAMWGNAMIGVKRLDSWIDEFIHSSIDDGDDIGSIGERLAARLAKELQQMQKPWKELVLGIHIAGYKDGLPRLWHIHCGHEGEPEHEPRLHRDLPDDSHLSDDEWREILSQDTPHVRNGYWQIYARLYDALNNHYINSLSCLNIKLPKETLKGHLEFQKLLAKFVAGTLIAAEEHPGVNDELSCIAFTEDGLKIDERLQLGRIPALTSGTRLMFAG